MAVTIRLRTGAAATWTTNNPTLAAGEIGFESDTYKFKIGDGTTNWNSRAYYVSSVASHTHDAADVTSGTFANARISQASVTQHQAALSILTSQLSGTISTAQIANNAVDNTKLADMPTARIKGRVTASTGDPEDLTAAQVKTLLAIAASDVSYSNSTSGLVASTAQAAIDELDAAVDALSGGAGAIVTLDLAGASTANFPSGSASGKRHIIVNAHANGTTLGSTNQIVVNTNDILLAVAATPSTTNGADWHLIDTTDKVVSVAGKIGAVVLAAGDIASGTFADARIAASNVTQHQAALSILTSQLSGTISTAQIANNAVDNTKIRDSAGVSVIGRASNTTGDVADIVAGTDGHVLRRSGTTLGFGTLAAGAFPNDIISDAMLRNSAALSVIGRSANSTGDPADIAAGTDGHVLRRSGTTLGFGTLAAGAFGAATIPLTALENTTGPVFLGRQTASAGATSALSMATAASMIQASLSINGSQLTGTIDGGTP